MLTAGMDEVGWGPLAGPVIAVVYVASDRDLLLLPTGVTDSKKLSKKALENLYLPLIHAASDIGLGYATAEEIDSMTPGVALQLCYKRALEELHCTPDMLIMDGNNRVQAWRGKQICEPKADFKYKQVSAASIVAKVFRDQLMTEYSKMYPAYGWERNAGYGTAEHEEAISKNGLVLGPTHYLHRARYCKKFL